MRWSLQGLRQGVPLSDLERAARHFGVTLEEVTLEMLEALPPRGTGLRTGGARGISQETEEGSTWKGLVAIGIVFLGIIVADRFTGGKTSRWLT